MKGLKLSLVIMAAALLTVGLSGMAYAYHSGGVADCDGCHSMHAPKTGGSYLLQGTDESSTCLNCHAHNDTTPSSFHIMTYPVPGAGVPPAEMTPGGDFAWVLKTYTYSSHGTATTEQGMTHGHNPVAFDYGIAQDTILTTAPGGTFSSANMACPACHDPHGKYRRIGGDTPGSYTIGTTGAPIIGSGSYNNSLTPTAGQAVGSYRLLAGMGYTTQNGALSIPYPGIPVAVAPSTYNQAETSPAGTNQIRVAYGYSTDGAGLTSWGEWCGACHTNFHSTSTGSSGILTHPTDVALSSGPEQTNYGLYVSSGIMTGTPATSYLSLVPFIQNSNDYSTAPTTGLKSTASGGTGNAVNPTTVLTGPGSTDQVSCPSCHRAHASGWQYNLRWNMNVEFITYASGGVAVWPGTDNAGSSYANGRLSTETMAAYYNRPATIFGASGYQPVLCNKCHAQD